MLNSASKFNRKKQSPTGNDAQGEVGIDYYPHRIQLRREVPHLLLFFGRLAFGCGRETRESAHVFFRFAKFVLQGDDVVLSVLTVVVMCKASMVISTTGTIRRKTDTRDEIMPRKEKMKKQNVPSSHTVAFDANC